MPKILVLPILIALFAAGAAHAEAPPLDVESLPRSVIKFANGIQVTIVRYEERNWTEIDPSAILAQRDSLYKDVCFEGKFESYIEPLGLKLTGVDGRLLFEDKSKRKAAPEMKPLDNLWVCGTLQPSKNGLTQELLIFDVAKLQPDAQRFENKFATLEHSRNAQGLIDIGLKIDQSLKNSRNNGGGGVGLNSYDRMLQLRDKAWTLAISIKIQDLRPNDANACYEIAVMYSELLQKNALYRQWVLKSLQIDPEHGNASKDAERKFGMIKVGGEWFTKKDYEEKQRDQERNTLELAERLKQKERERDTRRAQEIAERTVRLLDYQAALRTNDPAARVGAITTLGDEIKKSLDLGFSLAAVDILTNMNDPAALSNGMDAAAKSEFMEVRQLVYTSLAWRAAQNDVNSAIAYDVLGTALRAEKLKEPAQAVSDALVETGGKNAVATLIAGLDSNEPAVCDAMIDGLKKITKRPLQKKEEWQAWWSESKGDPAGKAFESVGIK